MLSDLNEYEVFRLYSYFQNETLLCTLYNKRFLAECFVI
jgi:hypothetical protein